MTKTVALLSEQDGWGRGLVASLPGSLRLAHGAEADLALVDGAPGWTDRATDALSCGARHVIVLEPVPADPAALADAADALGVPVALASALADHPALDALRALLDDSFAELVLDANGSDSLDALLFAQLRLLRGLGVQDLALGAIGVTSSACIIEGQGVLGGTPRRLRLTCARAPHPARITLTAHAAAATARLVWHGGAEARPLAISIVDAAGLRQLPAIHEGGHRHVLRSVLAQGDAASAPTAVRDFGHLAALLPHLTVAR